MALLFGVPAAYCAFRSVGLRAEANYYHSSSSFSCTYSNGRSCHAEAQATVDSRTPFLGEYCVSKSKCHVRISFKDLQAGGAARHESHEDGGEFDAQHSEFISRLSDGGTVTALLWKGRVVELRSGDAAMQTEYGLDQQADFNRVAAIILAIAGVPHTLVMWVAYPDLARSSRRRLRIARGTSAPAGEGAAASQPKASAARQLRRSVQSGPAPAVNDQSAPLEYNDVGLMELTLRPSLVRVVVVVMFFVAWAGAFLRAAILDPERSPLDVGLLAVGLLFLLPAWQFVRYGLKVVLYATPDWLGITSIDGSAARGIGCSLPRDEVSSFLWDKGSSGIPTLRLVPKVDQHGRQVDVAMAALWPRRRVEAMAQQCGVPFGRRAEELYHARYAEAHPEDTSTGGTRNRRVVWQFFKDLAYNIFWGGGYR
jgi:hypothetical protein